MNIKSIRVKHCEQHYFLTQFQRKEIESLELGHEREYDLPRFPLVLLGRHADRLPDLLPGPFVQPDLEEDLLGVGQDPFDLLIDLFFTLRRLSVWKIMNRKITQRNMLQPRTG